MSETSPAASGTESLMPSARERAKLRNIRRLKDRFSKWGITAAGMAVVGALGLIFFYLFSEVFPLLKDADVDVVESYPVAQVSSAPNRHLTLERYEQIGASITAAGGVEFFEADHGKPLSRFDLSIPAGAQVSAVGNSIPNERLTAFGFSNGELLLTQINYALSYPNDQRKITPQLAYPLGESPIALDPMGAELTAISVQVTGRGHILAAITADNRIQLGSYTSRTNLMTGKVSSNGQVYTLPALPNGARAEFVQVDQTARHLVVADDRSQLHIYDIANPASAVLTDSVPTERGQVTAMEFLVGTGSLVIGTDTGSVSQWLLVRDPQNVYHVQPARDFESLPGAVSVITPEYTRRGFLVGDNQGYLGIYHGTASRTLLVEQVTETAISQLAISPINRKLLILDDSGQVSVSEIWNEHPEISFSSLWQKVWYEGRAEPDYVWQASSGGDEFESKMSLVPLSLGTLKAALFAMLFAIPLGIMGALYTAYFMTPKMRGLVKPTIEIMEALPTVILGFLAGLWLAPFLENHLPAVFSILVLMPLVMVLVGYGWAHLPQSIRHRVSDGWKRQF